MLQENMKSRRMRPPFVKAKTYGRKRGDAVDNAITTYRENKNVPYHELLKMMLSKMRENQYGIAMHQVAPEMTRDQKVVIKAMKKERPVSLLEQVSMQAPHTVSEQAKEEELKRAIEKEKDEIEKARKKMKNEEEERIRKRHRAMLGKK